MSDDLSDDQFFELLDAPPGAGTFANFAAAQPLTAASLDHYRGQIRADLEALRAEYARAARQAAAGLWADPEPSIRDVPVITGWSVNYRVRPGSWFVVRSFPGSSIGWLFVSAFDAERAQAAHPDLAPGEPPSWAADVMRLA